MEQDIIEDFKKDYPQIPFPFWKEIPKKETEIITKELFGNLGILHTKNKLLENLYDCMAEHPDSPIEYESIDLENILSSLSISSPEYIYINWHRLETLDKMNLEDFGKYLFDIWYGFEDLEIISGELDWVIALTHYDVVKYKKALIVEI